MELDSLVMLSLLGKEQFGHSAKYLFCIPLKEKSYQSGTTWRFASSFKQVLYRECCSDVFLFTLSWLSWQKPNMIFFIGFWIVENKLCDHQKFMILTCFTNEHNLCVIVCWSLNATSRSEKLNYKWSKPWSHDFHITTIKPLTTLRVSSESAIINAARL